MKKAENKKKFNGPPPLQENKPILPFFWTKSLELLLLLCTANFLLFLIAGEKWLRPLTKKSPLVLKTDSNEHSNSRVITGSTELVDGSPNPVGTFFPAEELPCIS